jgi:hypothetical protein
MHKASNRSGSNSTKPIIVFNYDEIGQGGEIPEPFFT